MKKTNLSDIIVAGNQNIKEKEYWLNKFSGEIIKSEFPHDYNNYNDKNCEYDKFKFNICNETFKNIMKISNGSDIRLQIILITMVTILLEKYTHNREIIIGTPIYKQENEADFINTVVSLRNSIKEDSTFKQLLLEIRQNIMEAIENQNYPLESLLNNLNNNGSSKDSLIFDIIVLLENIQDKSYINNFKSNVIFYFNRLDNSIEGVIEYNKKLYNLETISQISDHLLQILQECFSNTDIKINDINILSTHEKQQVLFEFNNTKKENKQFLTVHELFEEQVKKTPDRIAIEENHKKMTYNELNIKANQLARVLRKKGVKQDTIVGIMMDNSENLIVGIIAILKSGGAYLPIDVSYKYERIKYLLENSEAKVLITSKSSIEENDYGIEIIDIEDSTLFEGESTDLPKITTNKNLAYIIYTSGTTGNPKGVMIENGNFANYVYWASEYYIGNEELNFPLFTSVSFDLTVTSIFLPLVTGNSIIIFKNTSFILEEIINNEKVGIIKLTPSHLKLIKETKIKSSKIKKLILGGENLETDLVKETINKFGKQIKIYNEYGPTEATVGCMIYEYNEGHSNNNSVSIGKPINNTSIYILDKEMKPVPLKVPGEIYISGDGVARGYINNDKLTNEKIVTDPFKNDARMYRSGDYGKRGSDGRIEFLGRVDQQIKLRGYRIELEEIEKQLLGYEAIKAAVVLVKEDKVGEKNLCCYIKCDKEVNVVEIKEYLRKVLPEYMIPAYFFQIDQIPLTNNGKIDKDALMNIKTSLSSQIDYEAPRTDIEKKLQGIWKEVLDRHQEIGINDNFFEIGGHSLKATMLINKIYKEINVEIPLTEVFERPTIKTLADYIENAGENIYQSIESVKMDEYPLSSSQKRLFIINQFRENNISYNLPFAVQIEGNLNKIKLENCFKQLIMRHQSLRTTFEEKDGNIVQKILDDVEFNIDYFNVNEELIEETIVKFITPFDLNKAPLLRVGVIEINENKNILIIDMHHIISDAVSSAVLIEEFSKLYNGDNLPDLRIQYKDYAVWQNKILNSEKFIKQEEYWINKFSDEVPILNLRTDYPRNISKSFEGDNINFEITKEIRDGLNLIAKKNNATLYMVLLSAFNTLLYKYSGQTEIIVGSPISGRRHSDLQNIVGVFINTLAIKTRVNGDATFKELLQGVKETCLESYDNQDYPFESLVDKLNLRRDTSRNPLFDVMFSLTNVDRANIELENLKISSYDMKINASKFDITLSAVELEDVINFNLCYCTKLFRKDTMERFVNHFTRILEQIVIDSNYKIDDIEMLSEEEKNLIIHKFNDTTVEYEENEENKTINSMFEEIVKIKSDKVVAVFEGKRFTYSELNEKASKLATVMIKNGVKKGDKVGLILDHSFELLIAIFGALKAGVAYVPIDSTWPDERVKFIINDVNIKLILTQKNLVESKKFECETINVDDENLFSFNSSEIITNVSDPKDIVYIIYTSGTTGKPKGVTIKNINLFNYIKWCKGIISIKENDKTLLTSMYTFDLSYTTIFNSILSGRELHIISKKIYHDPEELMKYIAQNSINYIKTTPTLFSLLINNAGTVLEECKDLKLVILGGEAIVAKDVNKLSSACNWVKFINHYGPTETTIGCIYENINMDEIQNFESYNIIGKPINNTQIYILDKKLKCVPIGVAGELCIAGMGLSDGYINRDELTTNKFVPNPFMKDAKMYRTGDMATWRADGRIEFLGRIDNQVKIRGFRIELGETENQIQSFEYIKDAVVISRESEEGTKYLCAYTVSDNDYKVSDIREYLSKSLPDYMIPAYFVKIDKIPVTSNGKLELKLLPEPNKDIDTGKTYKAPSNEIEEKMVKVWQEVLGVNRIGIDDDYFALGGDSIKAIQIASRLKSNYKLKIEVEQLFQNPTVYQISKKVKSVVNNIEQGVIEGKIKLTPIQKRFFEKNITDRHHWNHSIMLQSNEGFQEKDIKEIFEAIIIHHDVLRSVFKFNNTEVVQINKGLDGNLVDIKTFDLINGENINDVIDYESTKMQSSIDLENGPLVKIGIFKTNKMNYLLISIHHLVIDTVSWRILFEDFGVAYNQISNGEPIVFADKTTSYKEWANSINDYSTSKKLLNEVAYWSKIENTHVDKIVKDENVKSNKLKDSKNVFVQLSTDMTEKLLTKINKIYHTEINDLLLAALGQAFKKWRNLDKVLVDLEGHGRESIISDIDITRTVGWFTSVYPVIIEVSKLDDVGKDITSVKENLRRIPNKGVGYGILKYLTPKSYIKELKFNLKPDISFNYLGQFDGDINKNAVQVSDISLGIAMSENSERHYLIDIIAAVSDKKLQISFSYNKEAFTEEGIMQLSNIYKEKLINVIEHCLSVEEEQFTPTDFGDSNLGMQDLEEIYKIVENFD